MAAAPEAADGVEAVRIRAPRLFEFGASNAAHWGQVSTSARSAQTVCGGALERAVAWIVCIVFSFPALTAWRP
jgi:hypothetical protein